MQRDWMQWIPCSLVKCIPIECSELNAAWLNAVYNMHREEMEPYWMQWFFYSMNECRGYYGADIMQHDWMQCILCSMAESIPIECSGFHAASLNAEDSMHCGVMDPDCMQRSPCSVMTEWIPCSLLKCILIECIGFHAAWLNAVDSMQPGKMHPDWMQWITCSMIKCSELHAMW